MAIATATPPSSTATAAPVVESIVAAYKTHEEAKAAVRKLEKAGVPIALMAMASRKMKRSSINRGSRRVNFNFRRPPNTGNHFLDDCLASLEGLVASA
jgi:hypothetical protein